MRHDVDLGNLDTRSIRRQAPFATAVCLGCVFSFSFAWAGCNKTSDDLMDTGTTISGNDGSSTVPISQIDAHIIQTDAIADAQRDVKQHSDASIRVPDAQTDTAINSETDAAYVDAAQTDSAQTDSAYADAARADALERDSASAADTGICPPVGDEWPYVPDDPNSPSLLERDGLAPTALGPCALEIESLTRNSTSGPNCPDGAYHPFLDLTQTVRVTSEEDIINLAGCSRIAGNVTVTSQTLTDLSGLEGLQVIDGYVIIEKYMRCGIPGCYSENPLLTSLNGLNNLKCIGGNVTLQGIPSTESFLPSLVEIGGSLQLWTEGSPTKAMGALRRVWSDVHVKSVSVQGGKQVGGQFACKTERARRAGEDGTCCT